MTNREVYYAYPLDATFPVVKASNLVNLEKRCDKSMCYFVHCHTTLDPIIVARLKMKPAVYDKTCRSAARRLWNVPPSRFLFLNAPILLSVGELFGRHQRYVVHGGFPVRKIAEYRLMPKAFPTAVAAFLNGGAWHIVPRHEKPRTREEPRTSVVDFRKLDID